MQKLGSLRDNEYQFNNQDEKAKTTKSERIPRASI